MLCRATNALISVRLIYNNLRKKYRNFCFLFCSFVCFPFLLPPLSSSRQPFYLPPNPDPPLTMITVSYTTKEYRQNMLRWKRHNRSAYTNNSTVEVKVIGGLFISFVHFFGRWRHFVSKWLVSAAVAAAIATLRSRLIFFFFQNFLPLKYFTLGLVSVINYLYNMRNNINNVVNIAIMITVFFFI